MRCSGQKMIRTRECGWVCPGEEWLLFSQSPPRQSELMLMENFR